jgi:hypothetical protein
MNSIKDKMADESKLLIDTSSDNNSGNETIGGNIHVDNTLKVSTINENVESSNSKHNKFLVIKLNNLKSSPNTNNNDQAISLLATPSQSFPISQISSVSSNTVDNNNKNSQKNKNQLSTGWDFDDNIQNEKNTPTMNEEYSDDEDVFDGELLQNFFNNNNNMNNNKDYREMEGQDTITSLTNNVYKRQLEKIKRKASLRKSSASSSSNQTLNNTNQDSSNNLSLSSSSSVQLKNSSPSSGNTPIMAIRNLFKSQESITSKKASSLNSFLLNVKSNTPKNSVDAFIGSQLLNNPKSQKETDKSDKTNQIKRNISNKSISFEQSNIVAETITACAINQKDSSVQVNSTIIGSKQDQMFDAIKEAIDNKTINLDKQFIDNIVNIVRLQEMHLKKKKDNARRCCFFAELAVFLIILVMGIMFVITVIEHLQVIQNKSLSSSMFNGTNLSSILDKLGASFSSNNVKESDEEFFFNSNYNSSSTDYATPF